MVPFVLVVSIIIFIAFLVSPSRSSISSPSLVPGATGLLGLVGWGHGRFREESKQLSLSFGVRVKTGVQ